MDHSPWRHFSRCATGLRAPTPDRGGTEPHLHPRPHLPGPAVFWRYKGGDPGRACVGIEEHEEEEEVITTMFI